MAQITSNGRFGICDKRSDITNVNPYNISGAFIMYVNNDDKIYYFILTSTTSTSSVTPTMSDIPGLNEFPTDTQTHVPAISIYTDNSDQSKTLNSEVYNGAKQWYNNNEFDGTNYICIDSLIIDNVIMSQYDGNYGEYSIKINVNYNDYIIIENFGGSEILKIFSDGSVNIVYIPAPDTTTTVADTTTPTTTSDSVTLTTTEETTTTPAPIKVEPTGLVNSPFTPTHTELPYVILYTEDDNEEHHKYNEALYENIMIDHNSNYNINKNCLIINDRVIPCSDIEYSPFSLDVDFENKCIYVHGHDYAEIGILNDNYIFELTDEVINLEYLESLDIFDHSSIGQNSTPTPNTTTSPSSTATQNPDLCNKKFTIYARVHDENGNIISNFNINNIIQSYGYGENYTRVYNDNSIIVYEFDNISPTYTHSIAPVLNENYYFEEEDNIELYNIGNENIVNYSNSLIFWPGGITGDEAWIYVDIYPRSIYTTTSPASTMTTTKHSTDTTTPSPDTTTPITTGYSTTLTTTELVTTPTTTSSTATVTVTNPDSVTGTPLPRTTTPITTELITTPTTTGYSTTPTTTEYVTTPTTTSSTATVTVTNPDSVTGTPLPRTTTPITTELITTPTTTSHSTTLTTTELVTTPTTTSSTATVTITYNPDTTTPITTELITTPTTTANKDEIDNSIDDIAPR